MRKNQIKVRWLVFITAAIISTAVAFVSARSNGPAAPIVAPHAPRPQAVATPPRGAAANLIRFSLYDAGIYPRQLRVPKGLTTVKIEDFSGGTAGLVIARVNGNDRVPAGQVKRNGSHWRGSEEIQLQPGNYEVYTVEHPSNRSQLVVEP